MVGHGHEKAADLATPISCLISILLHHREGSIFGLALESSVVRREDLGLDKVWVDKRLSAYVAVCKEAQASCADIWQLQHQRWSRSRSLRAQARLFRRLLGFRECQAVRPMQLCACWQIDPCLDVSLPHGGQGALLPCLLFETCFPPRNCGRFPWLSSQLQLIHPASLFLLLATLPIA